MADVDAPAVTPNLVRYWFPVVAWGLVIFALSTASLHAGFTLRLLTDLLKLFLPGLSLSTIELLHSLLRKAAHVAEYFVFGLLLWRAFRADATTSWQTRWAARAFLLALAFASLDELHQSFESGRTASVLDVGIDAVGAGLALLWLRLRARQHAHPGITQSR